MKSSYHDKPALVKVEMDKGVRVREHGTQSAHKEKYDEMVECRDRGLRCGIG